MPQAPREPPRSELPRNGTGWVKANLAAILSGFVTLFAAALGLAVVYGQTQANFNAAITSLRKDITDLKTLEVGAIRSEIAAAERRSFDQRDKLEDRIALVEERIGRAEDRGSEARKALAHRIDSLEQRHLSAVARLIDHLEDHAHRGNPHP